MVSADPLSRANALNHFVQSLSREYVYLFPTMAERKRALSDVVAAASVSKKPRLEPKPPPAYRVVPFDAERTWWQYIYAPADQNIESQVILFDPSSLQTQQQREKAEDRLCSGDDDQTEFFVKLVVNDEFLTEMEAVGERIPLRGDWCSLRESGTLASGQSAKIERCLLLDQDGMWNTIISNV